jgi:hypothetical protein
MILTTAGALQLLLATAVMASPPPAAANGAANFTTYLLAKYSTEYKKAIDSTPFFTQVLNANTDAKKVAYFFEQVKRTIMYLSRR